MLHMFHLTQRERRKVEYRGPHLSLFPVVGEVVQVEGAVLGVVIHLQRARLLTLFAKRERKKLCWWGNHQPARGKHFRATKCVLKLKLSRLFSNKSGSLLLLLLPRKAGKCPLIAAGNSVSWTCWEPEGAALRHYRELKANSKCSLQHENTNFQVI